MSQEAEQHEVRTDRRTRGGLDQIDFKPQEGSNILEAACGAADSPLEGKAIRTIAGEHR